jgi:hypothetical protein
MLLDQNTLEAAPVSWFAWYRERSRNILSGPFLLSEQKKSFEFSEACAARPDRRFESRLLRQQVFNSTETLPDTDSQRNSL